MFLVGDIGGTKTHLALFQAKEPLKIVREEKFVSHEFSSLLEVIACFLKSERVEAASFGIAGPVRGGRAIATNLPWVVNSEEIGRKLGITKAYLLNDLEANAYGIPVLSPDELICLNKGVPSQVGNQALIAAGTGLGEAGLFWNGVCHIPFACEGGHSDFAPQNDQEIEIFRLAKERFGHVSYERVLSGAGLALIYETLAKHPIDSQGRDPAREISERGQKMLDPLCLNALDRFASIYGAESGNLALKFLALGGVFIGGGIAPKMVDILKKGTFLSAFVSKGRFSNLLSSIPVHLILNDNAALLGACNYIFHRMKYGER